MKKIIFIFLIVLCSCKSNKVKNNLNDFNFSDEMTFDEFKLKVEAYEKTSSFPKIDD